MLKALELVGFKSFADKTRFEFPAGITVVVGPNGSGKSNIVDGIKWVLGEQSAKSLRGKEMADVIFKGSGAATGGRKPAGAAEATLVFDNAEGRLPVDAPEVHITRRVYRSGEGEYLINRQPARLKDIRDMFRGTGVGGDSYSLIEQGKVDRLLQASAKDRRAIFEEAAGISRFKAKKIEAQRRLERVEQNLLRLSDIVDEVDSRLRSVRNQAAKARRYREYSQRLQQLRTEVALADWRKLSERIAAYDLELEALREQAANAAAQGETRQALLLEIETAIVACQEQERAAESLAAANREQIAQREATAGQQRVRLRELQEEILQHRGNLAAMNDRAGDASKRRQETQAELAAAKQAHEAIAARLAQDEAESLALAEQLAECRRQGEAARREHVAQLQAIAVLAKGIDADQQQRVAAQQSADQCQQDLAALAAAAAELQSSLAAARQQQRQAEAEAAARQGELAKLAQDLDQTRRAHAARQEDLAQLQTRRRGLSERASLLEELERTLEGLGAGVKDALERIKGQSDGPLTKVRGVLADLIAVKVEHAAAIDIALGEASQAIVVQGDLSEVEWVIESLGPLSGRVTFLAVDDLPPTADCQGDVDGASEASAAELALRELAVGRADELVEIPAEFAHLAGRLLGGAWVARNRADALALGREHWRAGLRLVTLDGELLDATGALSLGPRQSATSIISRRSELRSLRGELAVLADQLQFSQGEVAALKEEIEAKDRSLRELADGAQQAMHGAADARLQVRTLEERTQQTARQSETLEGTLAKASQRLAELDQSLERGAGDLAAAEARADQQRLSMASEEARERELEGRRQAIAAEATAERVELARREQRLEGLQIRLTQFQDDERERARALSQVCQQLAQCEVRRHQAELEILRAQTDLALAYIRKEALAREIADQALAHAAAAARRAVLADEAQQVQRSLRRIEEKQHQVELSAGQVRHERQTLIDRFREDYQLDLLELTDRQLADEAASQQRAEVEAEVEALRRKIHQIGAVNLDALDELDELETRFAHLAGQHKDLTDAKQALERIIHKINADSRRLFVETLEGIRSNFQTLYRQAFGGGKADIVLEEGVDVLDAGVEIIATPPGKPSFNNSLLSGGEKALTAVALLLAIFQFRPSPFCVLDEVDAPFDEANIGRFIDVLNDFLGWTKFIIVTHSKKTMTAATTLYGVTMQESGVSKRVSVRFDDVTEDGHIKQEALDRQRRAEPDADVA